MNVHPLESLVKYYYRLHKSDLYKTYRHRYSAILVEIGEHRSISPNFFRGATCVILGLCYCPDFYRLRLHRRLSLLY
jgi:hypothetical protein